MIDHIFFEAVYEGKDCIEIAAVRTGRKGQHFEAFSEKVKTPSLEGILLDDALRDLKRRVLKETYDKNYVVVGLKPFEEPRFGKPLFSGNWLYLAQLSWPLVFSGLLPALTLDSIGKYHGIMNKSPGTATGNVVAVMESYWQLMRRYKTALTAEEAVRGYGGSALEELRKSLGF